MGYQQSSYAEESAVPDIELLPQSALLTRKQVSEISGFAIVTLAVWEKQNRGPKLRRVEGLPRYRVGDVQDWLRGDERTHHPCPRIQEGA